jgi:hypothetical protein
MTSAHRPHANGHAAADMQSLSHEHEYLTRQRHVDLQQRVIHGPVVVLVGDRIVVRRRRPHLRHTACPLAAIERTF